MRTKNTTSGGIKSRHIKNSNTNSMNEEDIEDAERQIRWWYPRQILRRTNWLYRVDSLRIYDTREMGVLWYLSQQYLEFATMFHTWEAVLLSCARSCCERLKEKTEGIARLVHRMSKLLLSEGYCHWLSFLEIAFYPDTNRDLLFENGQQFLTVKNSRIDELSESEAFRLTGYSTHNLHRLFTCFRLPENVTQPRRHRFRGEECLLHFLYWYKHGGTKLEMAQEFGGDPRRFSYSIRLMCNHLYSTFYHKISGDSMRAWLPQIENFRFAIWDRLRNGATVEEVSFNAAIGRYSQQYVFLVIPFDSFRIFSFLDDTRCRTSTPGISVTRKIVFL